MAILAAFDAELPPLDPAIVVVRATNPRRRVALMAAAFAGLQPATIAAVTGTNGKSSTVHFVRHIWQTLGLKAASVGTLGIVSPGLTRDAGLTTPDPVQLHEDLATLAREGVTHLAIEASSHGLDQHRLDGIRLSAACFTNLTHEHLDYHASMDDYFAAKARLFESLLPQSGTAVVNADSDRAAGARRDLQAPRRPFLDLRRQGPRVPAAEGRSDAGRPASRGRGAGPASRDRAAAGRRLPGLQCAGRPRSRRRDRRRSGARRRGPGDA